MYFGKSLKMVRVTFNRWRELMPFIHMDKFNLSSDKRKPQNYNIFALCACTNWFFVQQQNSDSRGLQEFLHKSYFSKKYKSEQLLQTKHPLLYYEKQ